MRLGQQLLDSIGYQGVAMVEFRRGSDGQDYFLEINGRLWGSLPLALHAGVDFAFVYDLLVGPLFMRAVIWGEPLATDAAEKTADVILAAFGPQPTS